MKKLLTYLMALLIPSGFYAQEAIQLVDSANQAYENQRYSDAITYYNTLLNKGYDSEDVHYNLANAHFKRKQVAQAIYHYEIALKINPSHEDARYNLTLAYEKTVDKIEAIPDLFIYRWMRAIYNAQTADVWAWWVISFFFLTLISFALYLFSNKLSWRKIGFYTSLNTFLLALICWFLAAQQKSYMQTQSHAIIMASTIDIISAPSEGSSQLFVLHEGTKVKIKEESGDWLKISLPNGNEGWVKRDGLATF